MRNNSKVGQFGAVFISSFLYSCCMPQPTLFRIAFFFLISLRLTAAPGDTLSIYSHQQELIRTNPSVGFTTYKNWTVFPSEATSLHKVVMTLSFKCPTGENCGEWDYLNYIFLRRKGSVNAPSQDIELGRFITPYGNAFSAAWNAEWQVDISDFESLLRDSVEIEYQHTGYETNVGKGWLIDLKFTLIEGTPVRNTLAIQKLWTGNYAFGDATTSINTLLTPQQITLSDSTESLRMRIIQSGHGGEANEGCAEFCPKLRSLSRNGSVFSEQLVWRDNCGLNAVYPQAGTWIYDRGNWCPGEMVYPDAYDFNVSPSSNQTFSMSMPEFVGASYANYVIQSYAIEYAAPNFQTDASIEDILAPSSRYSYRRFNPICGQPRINIRNNGSNALTSCLIEYGPLGGQKSQFKWTGSLGFMQSSEVLLPANVNWGTTDGIFEVRLLEANEIVDDYQPNNLMHSTFSSPYAAPEEFYVDIMTNTMPQENAWVINDANGNVVYSNGNFAANTEYRDTVTFTPGCYEFILTDSGKDGLSFWANDAGNGFIRFRKLSNGAILKPFNADFGTSIRLPFTVGGALGLNDVALPEWAATIYPNPSNGKSKLQLENAQAEEVSIHLYSATGQLLQTLKPTKIAYLQVELPAVPAGLYFVQVQSASSQRTLRWVVTN
ncbi:MAG: hypothetical protein RLZZ543_1922 [Bacteroidota bacterium]